jgi:uncharacterized protein
MALLIDGYNLLHASGILGRGIGPGSLERSRGALIRFLGESLEAAVLRRTTVVFDAREAPPGLPREQKHAGLTVRFADPGSDADALIEQLIVADSSPRRLIVVSSDHRLHKAARRRNATAIDSDQWYAETLRKRIARQKRGASGAKPSGPMTEADVNFWLKQFGLDASGDSAAPNVSPPPASSANPFPPGYGDDLLEDPP